MISPRMRQLLVVVTAVLTTAACTVSFHAGDGAGSPSAGSVPPLVRDNQAVLDLRSLPTREDVGLGRGEDSHVYDRGIGSPGIKVKVLLPGGTLNLLAFGVAIEAQSLDGPPPVPASQAPLYGIVVNVRYRDAREVAAVLVQQASTLGLSAEERAQLEVQARSGDLGSTVMQGLVLKNFLVEAEIQNDGPGEVTVNYLFTFLDTSTVCCLGRPLVRRCRPGPLRPGSRREVTFPPGPGRASLPNVHGEPVEPNSAGRGPGQASASPAVARHPKPGLVAAVPVGDLVPVADRMLDPARETPALVVEGVLGRGRGERRRARVVLREDRVVRVAHASRSRARSASNPRSCGLGLSIPPLALTNHVG